MAGSRAPSARICFLAAGMCTALSFLFAGCDSGRRSGTDDPQVPVIDSLGAPYHPLDQFRECTSCVLEPVLDTRVGDATGPGTVDSDYPQIRFDPVTRTYGAVWGTGTEVDLFDEAGVFIGTVGTSGGGPNELRYAWNFELNDGEVVVLDMGNRKWIRFGFAGEVLSEEPADLVQFRFLLLPDGRAAFAAVDRAALDSVGKLLVTQVPTGDPSSDGDRLTGLPEGTRYTSTAAALGPDGSTVLLAVGGPIGIQEWALDGRLVRWMGTPPTWLYDRQKEYSPRSPDRTNTEYVEIDAQDRLWIMGRVADSDSEQLIGDGEAPGELLMDQVDEWLDTRLDIWDLRSGEHLGSYIWDEFDVGIFRKGDVVRVRVLEYDEQFAPAVAIYRIDVRRDDV